MKIYTVVQVFLSTSLTKIDEQKKPICHGSFFSKEDAMHKWREISAHQFDDCQTRCYVLEDIATI